MSLNNPYKLIAFDIDGTIIDDKLNLCNRLIEIVWQLKKRGYIFTLVSARVPLSVLDISKQLGINNHVIALNGSFVTNTKHEVFYSKSFDSHRVLGSLSLIDKKISRNYYYQFDWVSEYPNEFIKHELRSLKCVATPSAKSIPKVVNKITLMGDNDLLLLAKNLLIKDKSLLVSFSHHNYIEITCNSISKFIGLKYYAEFLGINPEQIIAFGDGENDISMLSSVGLGVAMGNAKEHVKNSAKDVTKSNNDQGVAIYLEKLFDLG